MFESIALLRGDDDDDDSVSAPSPTAARNNNAADDVDGDDDVDVRHTTHQIDTKYGTDVCEERGISGL